MTYYYLYMHQSSNYAVFQREDKRAAMLPYGKITLSLRDWRKIGSPKRIAVIVEEAEQV